MTEVTESAVQTISMNDVEYKVNDLTEKAKYFVAQLQDIQAQTSQTRARLDQLTVCGEGFKGMLQKELENPDPIEAPVEGEVVN